MNALMLQCLRASLFLCAGFLTATAIAQANASTTTHPIANVYETVKTYLTMNTLQPHRGSIDIKIERIDSRLKLNKCQNPLRAFLSNNNRIGGKLIVGVRCTKPKPWLVYVPAEVTIFEEILVASKPLQRGHILDQTDISRAKIKTSNSNTVYFTDPNRIIGKVLVRPIKAGNILAAHLLQAPRLIRRGQQVTLLVDISGLQIRMKGHALSDGAAGDLVRVRNAKTKRIVEGIVKKPGIVQVSM